LSLSHRALLQRSALGSTDILNIISVKVTSSVPSVEIAKSLGSNSAHVNVRGLQALIYPFLVGSRWRQYAWFATRNISNVDQLSIFFSMDVGWLKRIGSSGALEITVGDISVIEGVVFSLSFSIWSWRMSLSGLSALNILNIHHVSSLNI